jgi:hypothetical protein
VFAFITNLNYCTSVHSANNNEYNSYNTFTNTNYTDGKKKPSRKELKKKQKRGEYERSLQAMGSKLHNLDENPDAANAEHKRGSFIIFLLPFKMISGVVIHKDKPSLSVHSLFTFKGGIGAGAEVGDQFTVSQQVKTDAQLSLMETAVDIKVSANLQKRIKAYQ